MYYNQAAKINKKPKGASGEALFDKQKLHNKEAVPTEIRTVPAVTKDNKIITKTAAVRAMPVSQPRPDPVIVPTKPIMKCIEESCETENVVYVRPVMTDATVQTQSEATTPVVRPTVVEQPKPAAPAVVVAAPAVVAAPVVVAAVVSPVLVVPAAAEPVASAPVAAVAVQHIVAVEATVVFETVDTIEPVVAAPVERVAPPPIDTKLQMRKRTIQKQESSATVLELEHKTAAAAHPMDLEFRTPQRKRTVLKDPSFSAVLDLSSVNSQSQLESAELSDTLGALTPRTPVESSPDTANYTTSFYNQPMCRTSVMAGDLIMRYDAQTVKMPAYVLQPCVLPCDHWNCEKLEPELSLTDGWRGM